MGRLIDLTGRVFDKLTVIERDFTAHIKNARWICECECGKRISSLGQGLREGETRNCGCTIVERGPKDISGKRYGKLVALDCTGDKISTGNYVWNFMCDCGNVVAKAAGNIVHRKDGSCGCDTFEKQSAASKVHGLSKSKEHKSWCHAKERTRNPNCKSYADYGGSGVIMSDDLFNSFEKFIAHIGLMPKDGNRYTLGRIMNSKGYELGNIRWETDEQQARNKGKQINNTSGKSGVSWDNKIWYGGENLYACAQWRDLEGKVLKKSFAVKVYGLMPAFKMACEYREQMIKELNAAGAGYSETHGK